MSQKPITYVCNRCNGSFPVGHLHECCGVMRKDDTKGPCIPVRVRTSNEQTRKDSGEVNGDRLTALFYLLMRDHLPAGVIEKVVMDVETLNEVQFTNGWLAAYAGNLSRRMR